MRDLTVNLLKGNSITSSVVYRVSLGILFMQDLLEWDNLVLQL